jgi:tetratricopeptide (TPR) repeat protein
LIISIGDQAKPINSSYSVLIEDITIETSGRVIIIKLVMPEKAEYLVYTLDTPDRTVLEIANAKYTGKLPDISKMLDVSGVSKKLENDGTFRFIAETENEMFIESTNMDKNRDSYTLQITLLPQSKEVASETHDHIPPITVSDSAINDATQPESGIVKTKMKRASVPDADRLYFEGYRLYREGQVAKSIDKLMAAVKLDTDHVAARSILATSLIEQGQRDLAYSILREGLIERPKQKQWARLLAQGLLDEGELSAAKEVLSASIPAVTDDPDYHALYAAILQRMEQHKDAAMTYRNVLKFNPENGIWWMGLAISLEAMSRIDDALFAYKNALNSLSLTLDTRKYINQRIQIISQQSKHGPT